MKSLQTLWILLLDESGRRCGTSTTRDRKTFSSRYEHESESFLTITLPDFGKSFESALDVGQVGSNHFPGFSRSGGLPRFLGGFLRLVFDRGTGRLLDVPSVDAILVIRQLTLMFGKINLECSPRRVQKAIDRYIECEQDARLTNHRLISSEPNRLEDFVRVGRMLWAEFFTAVDSRIYHNGVLPKHGPGATADKLRGNAKYDMSAWTLRLETVFPAWENMFASQSPAASERLDDVAILEPGAEIPVKVITVPKTLKTPRIIAEEPTCMQYMQQGILSVMMQEMARSDNVCNLVRFESQEPNQRLAREGSAFASLATLDLSEASDRVLNLHVQLLLGNHPHLRDAVDATRSRKADVRGHGVIPLTKFASMGSALCFPFEALVFATVIFVGIEKELRRPLTKKDIKSLFGRVRVYGDDIIVPVEFVHSVIAELEAHGFRVNRDKSFWTGRFRESCGKEYYSGRDVSIVRVRTLLPTTRRAASEVVSTVSLRNQLFDAGWVGAVDWLDYKLMRLIPFPFVEPTSTLLGRHGNWMDNSNILHDRHLHHPIVKGMVVTSESPPSPLEGSGALMKWFLHRERSDTPFDDKNHLARAGRPSSVRIKTRNARPW